MSAIVEGDQIVIEGLFDELRAMVAHYKGEKRILIDRVDSDDPVILSLNDAIALRDWLCTVTP